MMTIMTDEYDPRAFDERANREQQAAGKDDVPENPPEWAIRRAITLGGGTYYDLRAAFAHYIAAHEPAPVDPLREAVLDSFKGLRPRITMVSCEYVADAITAELRARGVAINGNDHG